MICLKLKFGTGHNFSFSEKDYGCQNQAIDFKTPFKRARSKLSENRKINVIGPTELKLWPFKDEPVNAGH